MVLESVNDLQEALKKAGVTSHSGSLQAADPSQVRTGLIDDLVWTAVFGKSEEVKHEAREAIHDLAYACGAVPSSIQNLYDALGRGEIEKSFTVPAHNIRALTYDVARALFRAAIKHDVGAFILEIARSEMGYTEQRPPEYAACILAAAIKEGFRGPVFIQGDHFQASAKKWATAEREGERQAIEGLIDEAIASEFYNIDIDTSTLVDLSFPTIDEQQKANYENAAHFTRYIRERQPKDVEISVGGEIGEVGKENTTPEEFRAYMEGYRLTLGNGYKGISKISIQTGTSHGGVPLADGTIEKAKIDFDAIRKISQIAREEYGLSGAVQHGASTLSEDVFDSFPKNKTSEIHLATGFQNMILDCKDFPAALKKEMVDWCWKTSAGEKKSSETDEQFIYKTRKKTLGPFKRQMWEMAEANKAAIIGELQKKFEFLFGKLGVPGTKEIVARYVPVDGKKIRSTRGKLQTSDAMAFVNEGEGE
ncbi:MAG TPA: class II fructose-bisphosphate aldolase [Thermoanaerobaculia bacterium]|nr:class II fructose-bisphosphate aldolase [Thermoanaerobaculia bacterium]